MLTTGETYRKKDLTLCRNQKEGSGSMRVRGTMHTKCYQRSKVVKKPLDLLIRKSYMSFEKAVFQVSNRLERGLLKAERGSRGRR